MSSRRPSVVPYTVPSCRAVTPVLQSESMHPGDHFNDLPEPIPVGHPEPVLNRDSQHIPPSPADQNTLGAEIPYQIEKSSGCPEVQNFGNPPVENSRGNPSESVLVPSLSLKTGLASVELHSSI